MWVGLGLCGFAWSRLIWVVGCDLGCGLIWVCVEAWRHGEDGGEAWRQRQWRCGDQLQIGFDGVLNF